MIHYYSGLLPLVSYGEVVHLRPYACAVDMFCLKVYEPALLSFELISVDVRRGQALELVEGASGEVSARLVHAAVPASTTTSTPDLLVSSEPTEVYTVKGAPILDS